MAKQNQSAPVDEQYLMDIIANGFSAKKDTPDPIQSEVKPEETAVPAREEPTTTEEKPKEPAKRKRVSVADYETVFLQRNELKARQSVYISREIHEKVTKIVNVLGGKDLSVGGYIDNVMAQHFETYMDEIITLYDKKYEKLF